MNYNLNKTLQKKIPKYIRYSKFRTVRKRTIRQVRTLGMIFSENLGCEIYISKIFLYLSDCINHES